MNLRAIARLLPAAVRGPLTRFRDRVFDVYGVRSYSQEGEDLLLRRIFDGKRDGFYVDVGAHHPRRFSNTHHFYRLGWTGINIEPNPEAIRLFGRERKRDTNLQKAVGDSTATLTYHEFDESALNTFDPALAKWRVANTPYRLVRTAAVDAEPLASILAAHVPAGRVIDFLSVDVEGLDLTVLRSNDWARFRPKFVLVEALDSSIENVLHSDLFAFMRTQRYELFAKMYNTLVFRETHSSADDGPR